MAPEEMASSIRHATALIPHQRALEEKLLGPLTANHGSPFGNHPSTPSGTGNGDAPGTAQGGQGGNPFPSLSFGLGLGPGASAGLGMFPAKPTRRDVPPTSGQQQPDSSTTAAAGIVAPQPQAGTSTVATGTGTSKPLNFIQYRRSSSAPPAPPIIATLYSPDTASTAPYTGDQQQQTAPPPAQPTQPEQQYQQPPRSPSKRQGQPNERIGAQRRHHQHVNSTGSSSGAGPYARPGTGGGGGAPSRRMVVPAGVGASGTQSQSGATKSGRPTPRLIMPFEMPTAPVVPAIGSTHTSRSGTPMSAPVMPTHSHPANYHPHPFARQDGADEDAQEVIAHLEEMRRLRGQQAPLFDPGYSFPTTTTASASFNTGSPHHQSGVPRPNGGPGAGGRPMVGRRYDPPSYPPPVDDSAYHQQQAVFGNQAHPPSHHHQPPPAHAHQSQPHEQQHFSPTPPRQDYWTAHPDGTYIHGHVGVNGLDEFNALGSEMDIDAMVLDQAAFDVQQMQLRQAFEQSQQQHHFDTGPAAPGGDYVPSPISAHHDYEYDSQQAPYPQHQPQQQQAIEFAQDYSMAVHPSQQHQQHPSSKLPARPLVRRSATSGPPLGSPSSSVSTAPAHTPPAGGTLPLRLPTPNRNNNNNAGSNLVPAPPIGHTSETFFDWNTVASPLPHSTHPDATTGQPEDPPPLQAPPPHTLDQLSAHSAPMPELEMKFDFNTPMPHQTQEGHGGVSQSHSHSHSHGPLDVDPLSHLGLPLSPHHASQTGLHHHEPYGSDAFPQTHRPSMYGFSSNFDAGFAQVPSSPTTAAAAYHHHPSSNPVPPPGGGWTSGFGFGSFGPGSMSGTSGGGPFSPSSSHTALGASGNLPGAPGVGAGPGAGGGLAVGRRLSRRASSFWLSRASLAGDLAGVGLGEF